MHYILQIQPPVQAVMIKTIKKPLFAYFSEDVKSPKLHKNHSASREAKDPS